MSDFNGTLTLIDAQGNSLSLGAGACVWQETLTVIRQRRVDPKTPYQLELTLTLADRETVSLVRHPVTVRLSSGKVFWPRTVSVPAVNESNATATLALGEIKFADLVGPVHLTLELTNANGLRQVLTTQSFEVAFVDNYDGKRLMRMLNFVYDNARLLMNPIRQEAVAIDNTQNGKPSDNDNEPASLQTTASRSVREELDLVSDVIQTFVRLRGHFERNARFKLQHDNRLTSFNRIQSVTHRTLEFIATHPQYLIPTAEKTGISYQGKNYFPSVTADDSLHKNFAIYENETLVDFLYTVLMHVRDLKRKCQTADDSLYAQGVLKTISAALERTAQLESLVTVYERLFNLQKPDVLLSAPSPTSIFTSTAHYRSTFELMRKWFEKKPANFENETFTAEVSESSRLYECYVLTVLLKAFGVEDAEDFQKLRFTYPYMESRERRETLKAANIFAFEFKGRDVTLFYEPQIAAGVDAALTNTAGDTGLIRTMACQFGENGTMTYPVAQNFWTPDFVIRVREGDTTRWWVMDAKYAYWPVAVTNYMQDVLFKYLIATAPKDCREGNIAGVMLFCGKGSETNPESDVLRPRSLRNFDEGTAREPKLEIMTLAAGDIESDVAAVRDWLESL